MNKVTPQPITRGPFTWVRDMESSDEVWRLQKPEGLPATTFCLKNYGGTPGPGFAGWKLVSGGPFDRAGAYASLHEALIPVTAWLVNYYLDEAKRKREAAERTIALIDAWVSSIDAAS